MQAKEEALVDVELFSPVNTKVAPVFFPNRTLSKHILKVNLG